MIIKECFKNELAEIKETVLKLPEENCIMNYSRYLEKSSASETEMQYIKILNKRKFSFILDLIRKSYSNKTKDQLLEVLLNIIKNGYSNLEDWICDESIGEVLKYYFADSCIHQDICNEMFYAYEELKEDLSRSKKEAEIVLIKQRIQMYEDRIKNNEKWIEEDKESVEELRKKIEE